VEGGLGLVEASSDAYRLTVGKGRGGGGFLDKAHDWLEEVVVEPHLFIELVDGVGLLGGVIIASGAEIGSDQG
jgi:hypothetical protein